MSKVGKYLLYAGYGLIVIGLIVIIVLSLSSGGNKTKKPNHPTTVSKSPEKSSKSGAKVQPLPSSTNTKPSQSAAPGSTNPKSPQTSPSQSAANTGNSAENRGLTNTGPGDVVGIFLAVSLLFTILHWRYRLHKLY